MEKLRKLLELQIDEELQQIVISNQRNKGGVKKIHIRPILLQNQVRYQLASYTDKQVFHENLEKNETIEKIISLSLKNMRYVASPSLEEILKVDAETKAYAHKLIKQLGGSR